MKKITLVTLGALHTHTHTDSFLENINKKEEDCMFKCVMSTQRTCNLFLFRFNYL